MGEQSLWILFVSVFFAGAAVGAFDSNMKKWQLTFCDEFETPALNKSTWSVRDNQTHCCGPFGGNGELELYLDEEVFVNDDGHLVLRTRQHETTGFDGQQWNYTSGWIDTQDRWSQLYGRWEANISLPSRDARGIWPAFWLMPDNRSQCWPTGGEIDIFEFNGNWLVDQVFGSYHWAYEGQCGKDHEPIPGKAVKPAGAGIDWQTGWHIYAVEWNRDRMDFFLDDELYLTRTCQQQQEGGVATPDPFSVLCPTSPMYMIFDQAVSSWLFAPKPDTHYPDEGALMKVDWVRVYADESSSADDHKITSSSKIK